MKAHFIVQNIEWDMPAEQASEMPAQVEVELDVEELNDRLNTPIHEAGDDLSKLDPGDQECLGDMVISKFSDDTGYCVTGATFNLKDIDPPISAPGL